MAATHDSGQLRLNGRKKELPAVNVLESHVIDPSNEQSVTAILDKIAAPRSLAPASARRASSF
jgi:hypothetical protein